ncbi:MAG TPA: hypothetical protein PLP17_13075, partial [Oligoflexia bacterium]|nr:hypothetical protein [Oligoflexia bacterium]
YNPEWQIWGQAGNCNLEVRVHRCPRGYAMLGAQDGRSIGTVCGTCCPLPASDMLTDEHVYVRAQCPPEHVVTGVRGPLEYHEHAQNGYLRCTKINPRYQLGKRAENLYYGYGISAFSERARRTIRSRMPAALRWGIGRAWLELLEMDGCISYPWGSLLTGAGGKCHAMSFHRLEYRGLPGDPAAGTAVKVYPECTAISSSFSPDARCLP